MFAEPCLRRAEALLSFAEERIMERDIVAS